MSWNTKKPTRIRIDTVFPYFFNTGAFMTNFRAWLEENHSDEELYEVFPTQEECEAFDIYYMGLNGQRKVSSLLKYYFSTDVVSIISDGKRRVVNRENEDVVLNDNYIYTNIDKLSQLMYTIWGNKWYRYLKAYNAEYDMLNPFGITTKEESSEDSNKLYSDSKANSEATVGDIDDTSSSGTSTSDDDTTETGIAAYNSDEYSNSQKVTEKEIVNNATFSDSTTATASNTISNTDTSGKESEVAKAKRELTRNGNLGNMAYQDLIRKELEVWEVPFWNKICEDLNEAFTLHVY